MSNLLGTKANLVSLALDIGGKDANDSHIADQEMMEQYYEDVMIELAKSHAAPFFGAGQILAETGETTYSFPATAQRPACVFYDEDQLSRTSVNQLEALARGWRSQTGTPYAFTIDREDARKLRVFPAPEVDGDALGTPIAWGSTFPDDDISVLYTESRSSDIADWAALFVIFHILHREFSRLSDHQDLPFAKMCKQVANLTGNMAGIELKPTDSAE